jgi:hypothetical protein
MFNHAQNANETKRQGIKPMGSSNHLNQLTPMAVYRHGLHNHLLLSKECDQLWVIIDRYTKMAHFIPLKKKNKKAERPHNNIRERDLETAQHTGQHNL